MILTNIHGISLPMAVWLLHDNYDYINEPNYISATSLLKSTKQLVLSKRVLAEDREMDISELLSSKLGNAVHDSIEMAWREYGKQAMRKLGYPEHVCDNIIINPTPEELEANPKGIPVWIEKRSFREVVVNGVTYKIGGKLDMGIDGRLFDTKTTSVWSYILGGKDEDYGLQGGIYRWLNPDIIKDDHVYIQFVFTDWQRRDARAKPDTYPQIRQKEYPVLMPSIEDTETFIRNKIAEVARCLKLPEEEMPPCTDKELWRGKTVYKYYRDPTKTAGRSTRNFDTAAEAAAYQTTEQGGKGTIIAVPGEVKACEYCAAFAVCKQKDQYYDV